METNNKDMQDKLNALTTFTTRVGETLAAGSCPDEVQAASRLFADMFYKLNSNRFKPLPGNVDPGPDGRQWKGLSLDFLIGRLKEELVELEESIANKDFTNATLECGDIGNFTMFLHSALLLQAAQSGGPDPQQKVVNFTPDAP